MTRSRGWTVTLNYFTEQDLEDMQNVQDSNPTYWIYGFEGVDKDSPYHPHIHLYVHYANARSINSIKKLFRKKHHIESVKDPAAMISYCKGYEKGKLKDRVENDYMEYGIPIECGVTTSSQKVIMAIQEGKTDEELVDLFPSFMMYHYKKVADYRNLIKPKQKTRILKLIDRDHIFTTDYGTKDVSIYPSDYNGESVLVCGEYNIIDRLGHWLNGLDYKEKVGYEYKVFNPSTIYLWYDKDMPYDYLYNKYHVYIENAA